MPPFNEADQPSCLLCTQQTPPTTSGNTTNTTTLKSQFTQHIPPVYWTEGLGDILSFAQLLVSPDWLGHVGTQLNLAEKHQRQLVKLSFQSGLASRVTGFQRDQLPEGLASECFSFQSDCFQNSYASRVTSFQGGLASRVASFQSSLASSYSGC